MGAFAKRDKRDFSNSSWAGLTAAQAFIESDGEWIMKSVLKGISETDGKPVKFPAKIDKPVNIDESIEATQSTKNQKIWFDKNAGLLINVRDEDCLVEVDLLAQIAAQLVEKVSKTESTKVKG